MAHTALARKYRPRSFADVSTQEHVSETLRRAVAGDRVGHAYLFCGPRGVGKTTLARVLAMSLNCPDRAEEGEPCGVCESCSRIWGGHTALDVIEIDAASNRGVDDARDLRERAMYAPSGAGRYKVYIVDEAHMLTREAWNALLKILEEPPPRVIFVFATTEPQKIQQSAAPILSRCQRFDFRRIGVGDIVRQLQSVLASEGSEAPEEALRMIARKADGGMRDALSLLDQVISLTGGDVGSDAVRRVLGLVDEERYIELTDILLEDRHAEVFEFTERLSDEGYDLVEFYHGLLDALRVLLRLRLSPEVELDLRPDIRDAFSSRAVAFDPADLVRMLAVASELEAQGSLRRSPNPRVIIEMLLLRLSYLDRTVALEDLITALGGAPPSDGGSSGATPSRATSKTTDQASLGLAGQDPAAGPPRPHPAARPAHDAPAETAVALAAAPRPIGLSDTVEEAWGRWLDAGSDVPAGLGAFLRSASVRTLPDGNVEVTPLPGPAGERLMDVRIQLEISSGLEPYLGRTAKVVLGTPDGRVGSAPRVSPDTVKEDTLTALFRQEPRLKRAVQELDLELMD